jgi:hypothetical protein
LQTTAGKRDQELSQRILANDTLDGEILRVTGQTRRLDLKPPIHHGRLRRPVAMPECARRFKSRQVERGLHWTFGQAVMGSRPQLIFLYMTIAATARTGVCLVVSRRQFFAQRLPRSPTGLATRQNGRQKNRREHNQALLGAMCLPLSFQII